MDSNQLRELATNAALDHWPPHLGVVSETDKIQYLADRLREVSDMATDNEGLVTEINLLRGKISEIEDSFEEKIQGLRDDVDNLELKIEEEA